MSWGSSQYDDNPFADTRNGPSKSSASNQSLLGGQKSSSSEAPPWLQESPTTAPPSNQWQNPPSQQPQQEAAEPINKAVPQMILYTRIINLILSACMILAAILSLLTTSDLTTGVLACYVIVFACLLCCFETHLKQVSKVIAVNFGFLYSAKSRCVFILFVGIILFSFSLFAKIIGSCMIANSAFNLYIIVRFPEFEDAQRKNAEADIQDWLAKNPAFSKNLISAGINATANYAAKNPDVVQKGAESYAKAATGNTASV